MCGLRQVLSEGMSSALLKRQKLQEVYGGHHQNVPQVLQHLGGVMDRELIEPSFPFLPVSSHRLRLHDSGLS